MIAEHEVRTDGRPTTRYSVTRDGSEVFAAAAVLLSEQTGPQLYVALPAQWHRAGDGSATLTVTPEEAADMASCLRSAVSDAEVIAAGLDTICAASINEARCELAAGHVGPHRHALTGLRSFDGAEVTAAMVWGEKR